MENLEAHFLKHDTSALMLILHFCLIMKYVTVKRLFGNFKTNADEMGLGNLYRYQILREFVIGNEKAEKVDLCF